MARLEEKLIREGNITNNCPACFNQELQLRFFQKHIDGFLYHKTAKEISHTLKCLTCKSEIFPVQWTDDIERSFDYFKKTVTPEPARTRFKPMFYLILVLLLAGIGAGIYYLPILLQ